MNLFKSFLIGGYECADLINKFGDRMDLLRKTGHDTRVLEDYALLAAAGIKTVREGIRWSVVERSPGVYDFTEVRNRLLAAQRTGIQQLWDVCHFGYPDGLHPTHPHFAPRLAALCKAFTEVYRNQTEDPLIITPINEISFLAWLGGDARGTVPFAVNAGFDQKYHLCKAAIQCILAIRSVDPAAQIMLVEPLIRVHPKPGEPANDAVSAFNEAQYQAMDMITGRMCPELGGQPDFMDLAGFNFYYNNQWEDGGTVLGWCINKRRASFADLLSEAAGRYKIPVVLSETGHFGEDRSAWMNQVTDDCIQAMEQGVDLRGVCLYPVLDRPDWDFIETVIPCGVWSYNKIGERIENTDFLQTVQSCHSTLEAFYLLALARRHEGTVNA
jgi:beta-glucosidase/6-phospho-beta-glucosidase/beta-galactosidase